MSATMNVPDYLRTVTDWHDPKTKPHYVGWYDATINEPIRHTDPLGYRLFWDGSRWLIPLDDYTSSSTITIAGQRFSPAMFQDRWWRGSKERQPGSLVHDMQHKLKQKHRAAIKAFAQPIAVRSYYNL